MLALHVLAALLGTALFGYCLACVVVGLCAVGQWVLAWRKR